MSVTSYSVFSWGQSPHPYLIFRIFRLQGRLFRVMAGLKYRDCCRHHVCVHISVFDIFKTPRRPGFYTLWRTLVNPTRINKDFNARFLRLTNTWNCSKYHAPKLSNDLPPPLETWMRGCSIRTNNRKDLLRCTIERRTRWGKTFTPGVKFLTVEFQGQCASYFLSLKIQIFVGIWNIVYAAFDFNNKHLSELQLKSELIFSLKALKNYQTHWRGN